MRLPMSDDLTSAVGRDIMCTWTELRAQLIVGLSSGLSGVPYWTSGIHRYHACQLPFRNFHAMHNYACCSCSNTRPLQMWRASLERPRLSLQCAGISLGRYVHSIVAMARPHESPGRTVQRQRRALRSRLTFEPL